MRAAIYPGTFDPITNGHINIVKRATHLFDKIYLAVSSNTSKQTLFSLDERVALSKQVFIEEPEIEICAFSGLVVDFFIEKNASVVIRGLRMDSDFDAEWQMMVMNHRLLNQFEIVFLMSHQNLNFISSRLIKEIASLGGDIRQFVHPVIAEALGEKLKLLR